MKFLAPIAILLFGLQSCGKTCKGCYLVEEVDGNKTELYQGEYCGDEVKAKEEETLLCPQGSCYYECK